MAMGKAVVTTPKAIEGIQAVPEEHVLIEDTPQAFSNAVSRFLRDQKARKRLGENARAFVKVNYNWPTNMKKFENLLQAEL